MTCPRCGHEMNRHAEKLAHGIPQDPGFDPALGGVVDEIYRCPACGAGAAVRAGVSRPPA